MKYMIYLLYFLSISEEMPLKRYIFVAKLIIFIITSKCLFHEVETLVDSTGIVGDGMPRRAGIPRHV